MQPSALTLAADQSYRAQHEARIDALIEKSGREFRALQMKRRREKAQSYTRDRALLLWAMTGNKDTARPFKSKGVRLVDEVFARPSDPAATWNLIRHLSDRLRNPKNYVINGPRAYMATVMMEDLLYCEVFVWRVQKASIKARAASIARSALAAE